MKIYIKGVGITKFGELWEEDLRSLGTYAMKEALKNANLEIKDIDLIIVSNMNGSMFNSQEHLGSLFTSIFGINKPALRVEGACASGSIAIHLAYSYLLGGKYKRIMVLGVEKMTDADTFEATTALSSAADYEWEGYYGVTFPALYALMARDHMRRFNTTREDLALISIKNHSNAMKNPIAQFKKEITIKDVLNAPLVASPLGVLDSSPISDGAAAIILSSEKGEVELATSRIGTSSIALHDRLDISSIDATKIASSKAYNDVEINAKDIRLAEVHDCFTIAELVAYEDLGFSKRGEARTDLRLGKFNIDGKLPVNTSGGLKGCGHPIGATGIKQAIEIYLQLKGLADKRQIKKNLGFGLTHNVGGSGATSVINIFKNEK